MLQRRAFESPWLAALASATLVVAALHVTGDSSFDGDVQIDGTLTVAGGGSAIDQITIGSASTGITIRDIALYETNGSFAVASGSGSAYEASTFSPSSEITGACNFDGVATPVCGAPLTGNRYDVPNDLYATTITVASGVVLNMTNWRAFATTIRNDGNVHCNGNPASGATGGLARGAGFYGTGFAGGTGNTGAGGTAAAGGNQLAYPGVISSASTNGGTGTATCATGAGGVGPSPHRGGGGGGGGVAGQGGGHGGSTSVIALASQDASPLATERGRIAYASATPIQGPGTGGGGGGGAVGSTGGGGGGGGCHLFIKARMCTGAGTYTSTGGAGAPGVGVNAGGGGGGGGGETHVICGSASGTWTATAAGGAGGAGGASACAGGTGAAGILDVPVHP